MKNLCKIHLYIPANTAEAPGGYCCQRSYRWLEVSTRQEVSATGQFVSMRFSSALEQIVGLVTKIGVVLHASKCGRPHDHDPNLRQHASLPTRSKLRKISAHQIQNSARTLNLFFLLHFSDSPLTITPSSLLPNALPWFQAIFTSRTSWYFLGIYRAVNFCFPLLIIINVVRLTAAAWIATRYGLDGPGIESRLGEIFRTHPDLPWGPPSLLYNGYRIFFPGVKRPGALCWPPTPIISAEVFSWVELYLYSP